MSDQLFSVENKICIVTGGLGQIGKNFVQELWKRGARVAVWGRTVNDERIAKTLGEEALKTSALRFYSVDITKKEEMNAALDDMEAVWGDAPDVLVNNAGIDTQPSAPPEVSGPFENFPEEIFREVVDVNLVGTSWPARRWAPGWSRRARAAPSSMWAPSMACSLPSRTSMPIRRR